MGIIIQKPGLLTTVQDLGRHGYQRDGIIVSGPMDSLSMRLANILLGNRENDGVLEVTYIGPTMTFLVDSMIAICGGNLSPTLNKEPIALNKPAFVKKGDVLEFGASQSGCRCYIAFKNGIQVEEVLGSKSTCLPASFGGLHGMALKKGDILPISPITYPSAKYKINWHLSSYFDDFLFQNDPIRFIKGRQYDLFDENSKKQLLNSTFTLTKDANRMGYRFSGPKLQLTADHELVTEGVTFGTVQVPSNGNPIILMADHQTTGGYPKIAQIISADLPRLAQLKPGDSITLTEISLPAAQRLALQREREIKVVQKMINEKWKVSGF